MRVLVVLAVSLILVVGYVKAHDEWETAQWAGQFSDPYVRADHPQLKVHAPNGTMVDLKVRVDAQTITVNVHQAIF